MLDSYDKMDISNVIETAFQGFDGELGAVAAGGLIIGMTMWGLPKAISFFKKLAK